VNELQLTFLGHLDELRKRIIMIVLAMLVGALVCFQFVDKFVALITQPANQLDFIYLSPPELFIAYIKISLVMGLVITMPFTLFQVWLFLKPGLTKSEKSYLVLALSASACFFLVGAGFAFYVIVPFTIKFFIGVATPQITPLFSFESYVSFVSAILLSFGLIFEMPLLVVLLTQIGLVTPQLLSKSRKIIILLIFIVAAILTPPDVISQLLMAAPMLVLFEISLVLSKIVYRRKGQKVA